MDAGCLRARSLMLFLGEYRRRAHRGCGSPAAPDFDGQLSPRTRRGWEGLGCFLTVGKSLAKCKAWLV